MFLIKILGGAAIVALLVVPFKYLYRQPGSFVSFDVKLNAAGGINIIWNTAGKVNKARFEIERSREQRIWNRIAVITSQLEGPYIFTDTRPEKGINYYRVKQVETNGRHTLSAVKSIHVRKNGEWYVWPDPVIDVLHVRTPFTKGSIEIIDANGRILLKKTITAFTTDISVVQLKKGIYFVRIKYNDNKQAVEQFVKG